eukprot:c3421_g1_i1.p1 GENE.c3421_g1_i1~~c3421_g1_i1.p1  ORF type:complete len:362 (+),score=76.14 c3421_g1_i1:1-1086(+)
MGTNMKFVLALFLALPLVLCATYPSFDDYCKQYNKHYTATEYRVRKQLYETRVRQIDEHNSKGTSSHVKGINHLTDQTEAELSSLLGFNKHLHQEMRQNVSPLRPRTTARMDVRLPESFDWTEKGATTPVKNQLSCGSCWAFAGTESIESCAFLDTGSLVELAPQQFVDCVENTQKCGGSGGCEGATPDVLFQYAVGAGAVTEKEYPYVAHEQKCESKKTAVRVGNYVDVENNNYEALLTAVVGRPVTIGVAASEWFMYDSGVFSFDECGSDVNHAVLLVGYGTDEKFGDYWKVQNSWGPGWGEKGFIRLARNATDSTNCQVDKTPLDGFGCPGGPSEVTICGTCGLLYGASYPVNCTIAA